MTMPKTLAAEPSSQYATDLEFAGVKDEALEEFDVELAIFAVSAKLRPSAPNGEDVDGL